MGGELRERNERERELGGKELCITQHEFPSSYILALYRLFPSANNLTIEVQSS